jgi:ParB family transcriptional regulator, chromosome partitioning protein
MNLPIADVFVDNRLRKEMGNIDELSNSIREYGLIQPIIISYDDQRLIAGGRRLEAVKRLGWKELLHGRDFVWREELDKENKQLRLQAVELEENLKRKELTWLEQVEGKRRLLTLMQGIYGQPKMGAPTRSERADPNSRGFGVNRLAAMLGENKSITSQDLELADAVERIPSLRRADTKESARRQMSILGTVVQMKQTAQARASLNPGEAQTKLPWVLHEGDFLDNCDKIADESVDLVYTDLPFGVSLSAMSKHSKGLVEYSDSRESVVSNLAAFAVESFRMLHDNRFAVFFFGYNYYNELVESLESAGFGVNYVPVVWYKHTRSTEDPNKRYANAYDPAIVATKGSPVLIRPGGTNVIDVPAVTSGQKIQIAQQPVTLVERFILDMTAKGAVVCDFCAGSGTTGEAAIRNKREAILFEREPAACAVIKARLGAL